MKFNYPKFDEWNENWLKNFIYHNNREPHKSWLSRRRNVWVKAVCALFFPICSNNSEKISLLMRLNYEDEIKHLVYKSNPFLELIPKHTSFLGGKYTIKKVVD